MELTAIKGDIKRNYSGEYEICLTLPKQTNVEPLNELFKQSKTMLCKLTRKSDKRSLNSNNYAWTLITQIADVLRSDKDAVYLQMLKRYGQSSIVSVVEAAAEVFKKSIKYHEECGQTMLNGKNFIHIKVYVGSSEFDTKQMAIFLDGVVSECNELNICTLLPNELQMLKEQWRR